MTGGVVTCAPWPSSTPGLTPVAKGNGYGFGLGRLARKAQWLGVDTLAVGTYDELPEIASRFDGDLLVLTPWRPFGAALEIDPAYARRVVHTLGRPGRRRRPARAAAGRPIRARAHDQHEPARLLRPRAATAPWGALAEERDSPASHSTSRSPTALTSTRCTG